MKLCAAEFKFRRLRVRYGWDVSNGGGNFLPRVSLQLREIALRRVTLGMPALLSARLCLARFPSRPTPQTTERQRQLLDDAKELVQMHERAQQIHCNFQVPNEISDEFLRWVADLSDEDLAQLHRYDSTLDVASEPAELIFLPSVWSHLS